MQYDFASPSRNADALLAFKFDTYSRYRESLNNPAVIKSVRYRQHYDDVEIKIGHPDHDRGGLLYSRQTAGVHCQL